MNEDSNQRLEYLYKEYVRLSDKADDLINSTYEDFKLFGVVGAAIVVWKPISEIVLPDSLKIDSSLVLFIGFLSLLIILGLVALLNLIKQAYSWYFVHNLQAYEVEIRKELAEATDSQVFRFNLAKEEKRYITAVYRLSFKTFVLSLAFAVILIPSIVLYYSSIFYAILYLLISLIGILAIYVQIFKRMIRQYSSGKYW